MCRSAGTSVAKCWRRNSLNTGSLLCSTFWKPKKVYLQLVSPKASSLDLQDCLLAVPQYGGEKEIENFLVCPFKNNVFAYFFWKFHTIYFDYTHSLPPTPPRSSPITVPPPNFIFFLSLKSKWKTQKSRSPSCVGQLFPSLCLLWSVVVRPSAKPLKKTDVPSLHSYQLPIVPC